MLLSVENINDSNLGAILDVWLVGGEHKFIRPPFSPFLYSRVLVPKGRHLKLKFLSDLKEHDLWQVDFKTTTDLESFRNENTIQDGIPFIQLIAIINGFDYPSPEPKCLAWDCESFTKGLS